MKSLTESSIHCRFSWEATSLRAIGSRRRGPDESVDDIPSAELVEESQRLQSERLPKSIWHLQGGLETAWRWQSRRRHAADTESIMALKTCCRQTLCMLNGIKVFQHASWGTCKPEPGKLWSKPAQQHFAGLKRQNVITPWKWARCGSSSYGHRNTSALGVSLTWRWVATRGSKIGSRPLGLPPTWNIATGPCVWPWRWRSWYASTRKPVWPPLAPHRGRHTRQSMREHGGHWCNKLPPGDARETPGAHFNFRAEAWMHQPTSNLLLINKISS